MEATGDGGKTIYNTFSPEVRDNSYFHALNQIFRQIENTTGLSYGTISEVSDVEKTAEEVKSSKQRSFVRVCDIQKNLQTALEQLAAAVLTYDRLLFQNSNTDATITCQFGDGVLEDTEKEFNRQLAMVQARVLKPEQLLQYHFQCTEEEARNLLPEQQDAGGLFDGGAF